MDAEREGRISLTMLLPMLMLHLSASKFGKRCDPCLQPTRQLARRRQQVRDPPTILCPGPLQCRAPMPQSSFLTHSTALVLSHQLRRHVLGPTFVTHHQQRAKERQTPDCLNRALCLRQGCTLCCRHSSAPPNSFHQLANSSRVSSLHVGTGRRIWPSTGPALGPGWLHQLDEFRYHFIRHVFHIAFVAVDQN